MADLVDAPQDAEVKGEVVKEGEVKDEEVTKGEVKGGEVKEAEVKGEEVKEAEVKGEEVKEAEIPAAVPAAATKKLWSDEEFGEDEMSALKLSEEKPEHVVDKPEHFKSEELVEPDTIKKVPADADTLYTSATSFEELNLSSELLQGLYSEMKFEKPSKIQAATLPMIVSPPYQNLIAQAHNGSGKTTCFVLGMLSRVDPNLKAPQALCVCPTRELAVQNEAVVMRVGKYTGVTTACTAVAETSSALFASTRREKIVDQVIIGTPGTLKRWMTKDRALDTKNIKILVFDEADQMLDQDGFQDDSLRIMRDINKSGKNCQVLLFSATFSEKVKAFAMRTIPKANYIFVEKEALSLDVIRQYQIKCPNVMAKIDVLKDRIFPAAEKLGQSIIFVRTRDSASELHKRLESDGHRCTSIQGGLTHEQRDRVIKEFRSGETKILIATDVLARGFDQAQVTLVVNFDLPVKSNSNYRRFESAQPDFETYLHRIGRSGRFGRKGAAFNLLVTDEDKDNLGKIERHFNKMIPEVAWDDDNGIERVLKEAGLA